MHMRLAPVAALLVSACQTTQPHDPSSLSFRMPEGSTLTLNKQLEISAGSTHALLQAGKVITVKNRNLYEVSCRFDTESFGPKTIEPEEFLIRRSEDGQRQVSDGGIWSYHSEIFLDSGKHTDVVMLRCEQWGYNTEQHFSATNMQTALGNYFTFNFPQNKPAR